MAERTAASASQAYTFRPTSAEAEQAVRSFAPQSSGQRAMGRESSASRRTPSWRHSGSMRKWAVPRLWNMTGGISKESPLTAAGVQAVKAQRRLSGGAVLLLFGLRDAVRVETGYVPENLHALVHALDGDVLIGAVESIAARAQIGAGQPLP